MPPTCSVCRHHDRAAIDASLVAGDPLRNIAERFGTSSTALHRHKGEHLAAALAKAEAAEAVAAADLLARLRALNRETAAALAAAKRAGQLDLVLKAVARAEKQLELEARLLGELTEGRAAVNVLVMPEFAAAQAAILAALAPHPAARIAVADALAALGGGPA